MVKESVDMIIEGGKAGLTPQMGQKFGPLGINVQAILNDVNKKTENFKGIKVPVKIHVETSDKSYEIEVGSPPTSELIKKENELEKGSGTPNSLKAGYLSIEQVIKIAKMKKDSLLVYNLKSAVKNVVGSCVSVGILIEGKEPKEIMNMINNGDFDEMINNEISDMNSDKKKAVEKEVKRIKDNYKKVMKETADRKAAEAAAAPATPEAAAPVTAKKEEKKDNKKDVKKK
ncbi:50S ribosomal protein L11 [Candidatus Woesearchaeota archaeon]|nr:50S ribosomal protein L11 [Candidatus Woesearchaeota archaeon]